MRMVVAGEVCPWNPCSRGARRVAEVKEKRSLAAEKTLQQVRSHNKEKYLQPMHLPTSTFFFRFAHAFGRCTTLWEREKKIHQNVMILYQSNTQCLKVIRKKSHLNYVWTRLKMIYFNIAIQNKLAGQNSVKIYGWVRRTTLSNKYQLSHHVRNQKIKIWNPPEKV